MEYRRNNCNSKLNEFRFTPLQIRRKNYDLLFLFKVLNNLTEYNWIVAYVLQNTSSETFTDFLYLSTKLGAIPFQPSHYRISKYDNYYCVDIWGVQISVT